MSNFCLTPYFNKDTGMYCRCGKCENCKKQKRNDWSYRMDRELKFSKDCKFATFVTLTYKDSDLHTFADSPDIVRKYKYNDPMKYAVIYPYDWSYFLRLLQKETKEICGKLQRYYALMEYGSVEQRPHIHIILFSPLDEETTKHYIRICWDKVSKDSIIDFQPITFADITYCAKHNLKETGGNKFQNWFCPPRTSCSKKNGGIGIEYFLQNPSNADKYAIVNNFKITTPEFYRKKKKAYDNLMLFRPELRQMVLNDPILFNLIINMPCMQKYETKQRNIIRRVAECKQDALTKEIGRLYGYKYPDYASHVLPILRDENRRLRVARQNKLKTRTQLKIKHLQYIKTL